MGRTSPPKQVGKLTPLASSPAVVFVFIVPTEIPADLSARIRKAKTMNRTQTMWHDFYPLDVSAVTVSVAGLPEPATKDGTPVSHPAVPDEVAYWLPVNLGPVRRSVKVPASQCAGLTEGAVVVLGGLMGRPYPSKGWASVSLYASTVTVATGGTTIPTRSK